MAKASAIDVINFYKDAELEMVELVHGIGSDTLGQRNGTKKKRVDAMAKARAARKPKGAAAASAASIPGEAPGAQVAEAPAPQAHRAPAGRPARVPAPVHTAAATSVESDEVIG
jgi:hypothetical protein